MDPSLFMAAKQGNIEALLKLLQYDPLILERIATTGPDTPLHVAAMLGHLVFVKELIKHKINTSDYVQELNQHGFSAIHLASANGHCDVARELLEVDDQLCYLKGKDGMTPLHCACIKGRVETITILLEVSSTIISEVTLRKETALHLAVKNNQFKALEILVEALKQSKSLEIINSKDKEGNTILHLAAATKNRQALKLLVNFDATNPGLLQVNAMNESHLTALDLALLHSCDYSYDDTERLLRQVGAERARSLNEINLSRPQQTRSQPKSRHLSSQGIQDDWRDYFKFRFNESDPNQVRHDLLVVAVLMATATYQACLNPPGGVSDDDAHRGVALLAFASHSTYITYMLFNSAGFFVSLHTIMILTHNYPLFWELYVAILAMMFTYSTTMVAISPTGAIGKFFWVLAFIMPLSIPFTSFAIRRLIKWGCEKIASRRCDHQYV